MKLDCTGGNGRDSTPTVEVLPAWARVGWIMVIAGLVLTLVLLLFPELALLTCRDFR